MTIRRAACSCGQLNLTIEGEPSRISMCHCLECQRRTGAVISNQARFRREQVTFAGRATTWKRAAESGNALTFHFCPTCGSTVYWEARAFPDTSLLPSAASPTQASLHPLSRYGRSHATRGSPCRQIRHPSEWRSRGETMTRLVACGSPVWFPSSTFARARRLQRALLAATSAIRSAACRQRGRSRWRSLPSVGKCSLRRHLWRSTHDWDSELRPRSVRVTGKSDDTGIR